MVPNPADRPVLSAEEAFRELGVDRSTGYRAIREGTFPVEVIRVGRLIRVPTSALLRVLRLGGDGEPDPPVDTVGSGAADGGLSGPTRTG
jgi:excisionase family DNA binding protein